uniref:N-acetyltransferase domain-containing protein n=1 Tax=Plectus sambesii TaxID=2011161 RepID=A0A914UYJ0_9BILA
MSFTIEEGTVDDWRVATDLMAEHVHWYKSYRDLETYWQAYGKENVSFLIAKGREKEFYGCGQVAKLNGHISTIGVYFVHPEHQGKGIGSAIFSKLIEPSVKEGRNIGLNAAPTMTKNYDCKAGFSKYPNWKIEVLAFKNFQTEKIEQLTKAATCRIIDRREVQLAKLIEYDSKIAGGFDRSGFVEHWTAHPDGVTKIALAANGDVIGYATGRLVKNDLFIFCPLYADDDATARQLILALLHRDNAVARKNGYFFSTTPTYQRLMTILSDFADVEHTTYRISQFTKEAPVPNSDKVYSISDIGLGFI